MPCNMGLCFVAPRKCIGMRSCDAPDCLQGGLFRCICAAEEGECGRNNYKAVVAYDGTNYCGFQLQKGKPREPTIQLVRHTTLQYLYTPLNLCKYVWR